VALQLDQLASDFALSEGRIEDALSMLGESLRINRDLGMRGGIAETLSRFAHTLAVAGISERAARLLAASEALREEIGGGPAWVADMNEETHAVIHAQLDQAAFSEAWEQGRKLMVDDAVALALGSLH
jgi:hypothetical protein